MGIVKAVELDMKFSADSKTKIICLDYKILRNSMHVKNINTIRTIYCLRFFK